MTISKRGVSLEIGDKARYVGTAKLAVPVDVSGNIEKRSGRIHETTVGWIRTKPFEVAHSKCDIAADPVAVTVDITK